MMVPWQNDITALNITTKHPYIQKRRMFLEKKRELTALRMVTNQEKERLI